MLYPSYIDMPLLPTSLLPDLYMVLPFRYIVIYNML